ncbi:propionyl-CoA synthetase [Hirschia baltica]|uniref:AMP-dependent synthetase and ligase n=1 Tax=Hirschia baltica (strain ATCC 49814 / DSM 5838 / IFAM 1418) TaxID=582402 RepID=C6XKL0_HIRBI|nr:propionyl-CoA synthetase [Hirschia baltica]ACT59577.1 AMP-dependent synthetase and ligase [Hirschia baltica ATCC 49814]
MNATLSVETLRENAINSPQEYWAEASKLVDWMIPPETILDDSNPPFYRWYRGGVMNTCYNAVDRHVDAGRGEQIAIIYDSPVTGKKRQYTYKDLQIAVARTAGMLVKYGVSKGDRVIIYMPMVPEAMFAMLACARIGAVHSVVFGGFAPKELAKRIEDAKPKIVMSASCGIEPNRIVHYSPLLKEALALCEHQVDKCIILERPQSPVTLNEETDVDWLTEMQFNRQVDCVPVMATDPLYILYTSGTTGVPKGVVRDNGGHAAALCWSMKHIYGTNPGDVYWAASDIGWVVGHSYITYAPLLAGCTTIIYEGKPVGTPDPGAFWRIIEEYHVDIFFTAPTAIRAIKCEDSEGKYLKNKDLSSLKALFLAGERADPDTLQWAETMLKKPVIDHWWQTELGWPALAACLGLGDTHTKHGAAGRAVPGFDIQIIDENNDPVPTGETGDIVIKLPLPPGCLPTLWQGNDKMLESYLIEHEGFYSTGDAGYIDDEGFVHVMSRTDDLINVAGHRLSTGGMEQVLASHPSVAECAVVGAADSLKGQTPVGFVVLKKANTIQDDILIKELVAKVRDTIGPVAAFKRVHIVSKLPKTRSGKILRKTIRQIIDGEDWVTPATLDDPAGLDSIAAACAS